jgi:hypothetical protein
MFDVLCGRDKAAFNNIGNRRFRITVSLSLERYLNAPTRKDKSIVIKSVVTMVRKNGGRFLQLAISQQQPTYIELNEKQSHEKAGHALRDMALLRSAKKTSIKKGSKKDQSTIQQLPMAASMEDATIQSTSISSMSGVSVSNDFVDTLPVPIISSTALADERRQQLPRELDGFTDIDWDDSSDVTHDESIFDQLVQLVVDSSPILPETSSPLGTGMHVVNDLLPAAASYPIERLESGASKQTTNEYRLVSN